LIFYFAYIIRFKLGIKRQRHADFDDAVIPHDNLGNFMYAVIMLIDQIINIYIWTLLIYIAVGWLVAFRIVNPWQPVVRMITDVLARIHEPLLGQVRRFLPDLGPVDISPIVLFLAAQFIRNLLISSLSG
jgi:YggT family protein